ncbi:hybrid sensor histidine kinase/response regulator transcription factor [Flavihumibacter sp. UBA7668]|uniref:hybrid sensor histidine kinase/response regulator transcription factor n=1 Tax=Flavihumibacter sp. UBA7668 TaxID=1946542 RepID=UPI0025B953F9|nr:ATP-binding protein [Flavihumibacter sp. UBA7668]
MQTNRSFISWIIVFNCLAIVAFPQQRLSTNQQHFGVDDGLPQSYISSIVQDDDGFLWIGTLDGLSRYDGRSFRNFRNNPADSNSIASSVIVGRGKLQNNSLTLYYSLFHADEFDVRSFKARRNTTRNQISQLPGARQIPKQVSNSGSNLFFLFGTDGIGWMNYFTNEIRYASPSEGLSAGDTILAIAEAANKEIFVVYKTGVAVSDSNGRQFIFQRFPTFIKELKQTDAEFLEKFSVACTGDNRVAILRNETITLLDVNKKTSTRIQIPPPHPKSMQGYSSLLTDVKGRVYFEDFGRIFRVNETDQLELLWEYTGKPERISAFYIDRTDVLWVSVNAQGLLKIDLKALHFESYPYTTSFMVDLLGAMDSQPIEFPSFWKDRSIGYYFRQAVDKKGNRYFSNSWGDKGVLYQHDGTKFHPFKHVPEKITYGALVSMPNNELWAYVPEERRWYSWADPEAVPKPLPVGPDLLNTIEFADAKYIGHSIWVSTYDHGLLQTDGTKIIGHFAEQQQNGILPKTLTEICPDPTDSTKFWIGSRSAGLILWDIKHGLQRVYTMEDGLPNNTIYCILPDKSGKLWCSTNKGIFRFDPKTAFVTAFEKTDGLAGNEFNRAHKFQLPDGRLAFGGLEGYTIFDPAAFEHSSVNRKVPVHLTGLHINNEPQDVTIPGSLIQESLSSLTTIELPYDKNYLRFEFAALFYNQPQKTRYRYQLQGVDEDWIDNGHSNTATYSAISPGNYILRINATDDSGQWSETVKEIGIRIHPPIWATWWAYLIYALLTGALFRWYFIYRERRLSMQQTLAFEKREAMRLREMDELKDRFFSNITHEFRTPLTLILTPLEKLEKDPSLSPDAIGAVKTAQRNSRQLLGLINEFLQFSKLNSGQLKVVRTAGDLLLFTRNCLEPFEGLAEQKNIRLNFHSHRAEGHYLFDQEIWEKILNNLLSNAIKFTPANGQINVELSGPDAERIQLIVSDTGLGIPIDKQSRIFTRFYQADDSAMRQFGGTGIGLSLVKELTELMGGKISFESAPGVGTSFSLVVPMERILGTVPALSPNRTDSSAKALLANGEQPLLLIAEDNEELRSFLVESLQQDFRILQAGNGLDAWSSTLQELPDLIISDVMMPGMDGFDLCQHCKADNRTNHIGFILLTSKAAHESVLKGLALGADEYITKPFNLEELKLRIGNLLRLQQKQRDWFQQQLQLAQASDPVPKITDSFLLQLYQEIDTRLDDNEMGVDFLCKVTGMSKSTLNRKLKSLINSTPNELIRLRRLQKAASLLAAGSDISSVAYQTGFSSPSYFSQCFKEQYGVTPSEWITQQV